MHIAWTVDFNFNFFLLKRQCEALRGRAAKDASNFRGREVGNRAAQEPSYRTIQTGKTFLPNAV